MVIAERAKQEQAVELGTATVHHRWVVRRRGIENAGVLTAERSQRAKQGICGVHLHRGQW